MERNNRLLIIDCEVCNDTPYYPLKPQILVTPFSDISFNIIQLEKPIAYSVCTVYRTTVFYFSPPIRDDSQEFCTSSYYRTLAEIESKIVFDRTQQPALLVDFP